jgi:hypothetical protein
MASYNENRGSGSQQRRSVMIARGRVENGVVVLADGVRLPEGQEVAVTPLNGVPEKRATHGLLDIAPVSLGSVLHPLSADDDLLGEMLEDA